MNALMEEQALCSWLDQHPDAIAEAIAARQRWRYIGQVADAALRGEIIDRSLLQVIHSPQDYARRAQGMVQALEAWLLVARASRCIA